MASLCMQDVVNDPNASDAIASSVSTSKNRYINTHTGEMSHAWWPPYIYGSWIHVLYTHDCPWVTKRCLKQTIFMCVLYLVFIYCMWSFMFDVVDHSRVILKVPDETGCDYINASYINVSGSQCIYVAPVSV